MADLGFIIELMTILRPLLYLWALPGSILGLALVPFALLSGGSMRIVQGTLEVQGGLVSFLLTRALPWVKGGGSAMTLGHVILGRNQGCLDRSRRHEHVHVRQYERWGPFFVPLYLGSSLILWLRGYDPYLDNPFEREAFERDRPADY
jgi:hypothetical protein